jgi:hypothetical protein
VSKAFTPRNHALEEYISRKTRAGLCRPVPTKYESHALILFISGVLLLLAVFVDRHLYRAKAPMQAARPRHDQSDASRVSLSDVFVDANNATPAIYKSG